MEPIQQNPDALCGEILAEARRRCDEIHRRAGAEAASILAAAAAEAEKIRNETRDQAQIKARRRKELVAATVALETRRMQSARVETLLESVREEIRRRLLALNHDGREIVLALASDAVQRISGNNLLLKISAADQVELGGQLAAEITRRVRRSPLNLAVSTDPALARGDVVVQDAEGSQLCDNRLLSRLERLWPELRRQIAVQASLVSEDHPAGGAA